MGQEKHMESYESGCLFFTIDTDQHRFGSLTAEEVYISKRILQIYFSLKMLGVMKLFHY